MPTPRYTYFIAHAGADSARARELYDLLYPQIPCFLDVVDLLPGDAWDKELREGQARVASNCRPDLGPGTKAPALPRRATIRNYWHPQLRNQDLGFRVVCVCSRQYA